jgi:hypothetical protein
MHSADDEIELVPENVETPGNSQMNQPNYERD